MALVDVSRMATLLENESRVPAGQAAVIEFFRGTTNAWENLGALWRAQDRANDLMLEIIDRLRKEYQTPDAETSGALTPEQLYFLLRDAIEPRPTQASISPVLRLLESPLVLGARQKGRGYLMPDSPRQIAKRLRELADRINTLSDTDSEG